MLQDHPKEERKIQEIQNGNGRFRAGPFHIWAFLLIDFFLASAAPVFSSSTYCVFEAYDEWDAVQLKDHTSQMAHLAFSY